MDFDTLTSVMAEQFSRLSPQLQHAARHALDRPDDVALMSMRGLAAGAGVHPSTMVRLARTLGCGSYARFREPFQQRLRVRPGGYLDRARDLQARGAGGAGQALLREVLGTVESNLRETFDANGAGNFIACARAMAAARKLYVVGLRSVFPVAFFFHYAYRMFRDNAVLLDGGGGAMADDLRSFGEGDVIFAISFDPYTFETVRAVEYARHHGGQSVVMTDSPVSPILQSPAGGAKEHRLIIRTESPSFFHSISAGITAAEALIALMIAEGGQPALDSIKESEGQLDTFHAYWHGKPEGHAGRKVRPAIK